MEYEGGRQLDDLVKLALEEAQRIIDLPPLPPGSPPPSNSRFETAGFSREIVKQKRKFDS